MLLAVGEALVTSLKGGRFPFAFCGGTLPLFMAALGPLLVSTFGRVSGRYDEVDGPRDNGLPTPFVAPPGAPTRRWTSVAGLTKSRELLGAGEPAEIIGLEIGTLLVWSTPAVLRMEGLSA